MKINLTTIIIFVQNVDKLKSFYVDIMKLEVVEEIKSEWLILNAGNCKIALHKIGDQYMDNNQDLSKFNNNTKIVFEIDNDIHLFRDFLQKEKVIVKEIKTFDNYNYWLCDGEDPEGNIFQLKQIKK